MIFKTSGLKMKLSRKCLSVPQEKEWVKWNKIGSIVMSHGKMMIYVKGASEIVLEGCNKLQGFDGQL